MTISKEASKMISDLENYIASLEARLEEVRTLAHDYTGSGDEAKGLEKILDVLGGGLTPHENKL